MSGRTPSRSQRAATRGFTLIEVLVALAVVAAGLAAIGSVIATTVRSTRSIEERLTTAAMAEQLMAGLVDRTQLRPGSTSGEMDGHRWRMDISELPSPQQPSQQQASQQQSSQQQAGADTPPTTWVALAIVIRVQTFRGASTRVETVRLVQAAGGA